MNPTPPSFPLIFLGSGIHDYPDHRKRLITECFLSGLAPVLVPPSLIPLPIAAACFKQLLAESQAYLGFLAHCYRPPSRLYEDISPYEAEWRYAVETEVPRRMFVADYSTH